MLAITHCSFLLICSSGLPTAPVVFKFVSAGAAYPANRLKVLYPGLVHGAGEGVSDPPGGCLAGVG